MAGERVEELEKLYEATRVFPGTVGSQLREPVNQAQEHAVRPAKSLLHTHTGKMFEYILLHFTLCQN